MSDYLAVRTVENFIREGGFAANTSSGWSWTDLRNINYFIENCNDPAVPENIRKNYLGHCPLFQGVFLYGKGETLW